MISVICARKWRLGLLLGLLALTVGCGVEGVGIRSVKFDLAPALTGSRPASYDTSLALMASGRVEVDVLAGTGFAMAHGLPTLPDLYVYQLELTFAIRENTDIPGIANPAPVARALGAALTAQIVSSYVGDSRMVGAMSPSSVAGMWRLDFSATDFDMPLASLRGATIYLMPTTTDPFVGGVLHGRVGADPSAAPMASDGHTGHTHGI